MPGHGQCDYIPLSGTHVYTISTTDITHLRDIQLVYDRQAGYTGLLGNYETILFIDGESMMPPFGDLPGHAGLGVFQRYETENAARDGHQDFVTRVKRHLQSVNLPVEGK